MKPWHWLSLSILLVGLGVGGYVIFAKKEEELPDAPSAPSNPATPPSGGQAVFAKMGERGPKVKKLQEFINSKGYRPPLATDSIFGPKTKAGAEAIFGSPYVTEQQWNNRAKL